jgi:hypothetical protein
MCKCNMTLQIDVTHDIATSAKIKFNCLVVDVIVPSGLSPQFIKTIG